MLSLIESDRDLSDILVEVLSRRLSAHNQNWRTGSNAPIDDVWIAKTYIRTQHTTITKKKPQIDTSSKYK